jgi:hypothetical protein
MNTATIFITLFKRTDKCFAISKIWFPIDEKNEYIKYSGMLESLTEFLNEYCGNFRGLTSETSGELELCPQAKLQSGQDQGLALSPTWSGTTCVEEDERRTRKVHSDSGVG